MFGYMPYSVVVIFHTKDLSVEISPEILSQASEKISAPIYVTILPVSVLKTGARALFSIISSLNVVLTTIFGYLPKTSILLGCATLKVMWKL